MLDIIIKYIQTLGIEKKSAEYISYALLTVIILLLCLLINLIAKKLLIKLITPIVKRSKSGWDDALLERKVFQRLSYLVTPLIISIFAGSFPSHEEWIMRCVSAYVILILLIIADALLNAIDDIYRTYDISKIKPIKGILQVVKILAFIIGAIIMIATLIGESPIILLGGLGALSAVFLLVFQSSILGFVAGIQLTSNDMVRIGDWIEMSKYNADGTVIDLTLTTVKVENFDRTITTIPANALMTDSFRNWRGMQTSGGRRIMRSINIDINSIRFCTEDMLLHYERIEFLKDYIQKKREEIDEYNRSRNIDLSEITNGRRLTNIGVFRYYVLNYLKNHPGIHKEMTLMIRQLAPKTEGLPLEIYAFANTTDWVKYENIQSDIFDHLFAVVPQFGLLIYQSPTGNDIQAGLSSHKAGGEV